MEIIPESFGGGGCRRSDGFLGQNPVGGTFYKLGGDKCLYPSPGRVKNNQNLCRDA